ncbi:hypothetical protein GCM10028808_65000 [Spirosoma migulaei]
MKKKLLATWLFLITAVQVMSWPLISGTSQPLKVGDVVYVHAPAGLTLRKTNSRDGAKVALVSYAASLTILAMPDSSAPYKAESIGSFAVSGGWVKVKTRDGLEGYLFDGYLLRYPPSLNEPQDGVDLIDWAYRTLSPSKGKRATLPPIDGTLERYKQIFVDGASFELQAYPGGSTQILDISKSKLTMQEALIFFRPIWFLKEKTTATYDSVKQRLEVHGEEGISQFTIQSKGTRLLLRFATAD